MYFNQQSVLPGLVVYPTGEETVHVSVIIRITSYPGQKMEP